MIRASLVAAAITTAALAFATQAVAEPAPPPPDCSATSNAPRDLPRPNCGTICNAICNEWDPNHDETGPEFDACWYRCVPVCDGQHTP